MAVTNETRVLADRYADARLVASGGMADVFVARDTVLERDVVVKVLAQRYAGDAELRSRFQREAFAAAQLSHEPNVVTVFDVGEHEGYPFIVMEYLTGGTVRERLDEETVSLRHALAWLDQAGSALDAAHAVGIVHRDVKPGNLLLDERDIVHVSDFGIAKAAGVAWITAPGGILGTAGYLSPEQARGEPATPASDRYALGVVAFELLTGHRPFEAESATAEAFAHAATPPPSVKRYDPLLPDSLDEVFGRALAKLPERRPRSCAELSLALRDAFRRESRTAVLPPTPEEQPAGRRRATAPSLLAGVGLGALLIGFATALAVADGQDGDRVVTRLDRRIETRTVQAAPQEVRTVTEVHTTTLIQPASPRPAAPGATSRRDDDTPRDGRSGTALNDAGYRLMQARDYQSALPLLEQAVRKLAGTRSLAEAYASYNLAFTRRALGRCDDVAQLLDRSQAIQGRRRAIERLRAEANQHCN